MKVTKIQANSYYIKQNRAILTNNRTTLSKNDTTSTIPSNYKYYNISFGESNTRKLSVPDIDHADYKKMEDFTKARFRKRYENFGKDNIHNLDELVDYKYKYLPLRSEESMNKFIEIKKSAPEWERFFYKVYLTFPKT